MGKNLFTVSARRSALVLPILALVSAILHLLLFPKPLIAEENNNTKTNISQESLDNPNSLSMPMILVQQSAALSQSTHEIEVPKKEKVATAIVPIRKRMVTATAYSSTVDQCDSTPFITANGTHVHDGTIAANFLKFGTKVRLPSLYGDKIFIVEDRMKSDYKVDIWFPTRQEAKNFGVKWTEIEIL